MQLVLFYFSNISQQEVYFSNDLASTDGCLIFVQGTTYSEVVVANGTATHLTVNDSS